ncbi:signal transduction histidine kinase [Mycena amicta]|nr:signal transduction histidine kinase [Mycena amicta]
MAPDAPIDSEAFEQILELDDDESYTFSKNMIALYFTQAPEAFDCMDSALSASDFVTVADRAHFLAGSSASLGIVRVADACARIESAAKKSGDKDAELVRGLLAETREAYATAEAWLRQWYADHGAPFVQDDKEEEEAKAVIEPVEQVVQAPDLDSKLPAQSSQETLVPPVPPSELLPVTT